MLTEKKLLFIRLCFFVGMITCFSLQSLESFKKFIDGKSSITESDIDKGKILTKYLAFIDNKEKLLNTLPVPFMGIASLKTIFKGHLHNYFNLHVCPSVPSRPVTLPISTVAGV